jgi:precorrin-6A/cobalt-precorrin-6A reductase
LILLLGGTSETQPLAEGLAQAGYRVLVSTATTIPLLKGGHPGIQVRSGSLDEQGLGALIRESGIRLVVDAVHPYAVQARSAARSAAGLAGIPCLTYMRPGTVLAGCGAEYAATHEEAALLAFSFQVPVLLTIGVKNLSPYAARAGKMPLYVRVLPVSASIEACRRAGIPGDRIIPARGPFSVEVNRSLIRQYSIGVMVTKDSGKAGGIPEKIEASRLEGCRVIMVKRPDLPDRGGDRVFDSIDGLISSVHDCLGPE